MEARLPAEPAHEFRAAGHRIINSRVQPLPAAQGTEHPSVARLDQHRRSWTRRLLREGKNRVILTPESSEHRVFVFTTCHVVHRRPGGGVFAYSASACAIGTVQDKQIGAGHRNAKRDVQPRDQRGVTVAPAVVYSPTVSVPTFVTKIVSARAPLAERSPSRTADRPDAMILGRIESFIGSLRRYRGPRSNAGPSQRSNKKVQKCG